MKKSRDYVAIIKNMIFEWKWLLRFVVKYKFILILYIFLGVVGTVMSLGVTIATKYLIDAVISHSSSQLLSSALFVVGFAVFQIAFQALSSWITSVVSSKANNEIKAEIYSHILNARWSDISDFHSGDLINRLEHDVSAVSSAIINFIPSAFTRFLQFTGALVVVLYYDKTMAFLALLSAPFLFLSSRVLVKTIRKYSKLTREINGEILSFTEESVQNLQTLKAFDLTKVYIKNFKTILENFRATKLSYDKFSILMTMLFSFIGLVVSYSCYGWGVYRLWQGAITYGTMTLFLQISGSLTASFGSLAALAPASVSIATSAGRIMEITSFKEECDKDKEKAISITQSLKEKSFRLVFENVTFSYESGQAPVLKNVSFVLNSGDTVAFVGPSGEGKTTLFKLILGLIEPCEGKIYVELSDGDKITVSDSTRRFCSYIPQTINVFSGTLADNVKMVNTSATDSEVEDILKKAEIWELVESLPQGINSSLNEQGGNFSQGQLQRIAIARALLKDSSILLMDEATSALDVETESKVLKNIMVYNASRLCLLTTHRESMLKYCDKVYRISATGQLEETDNEGVLR